MALNVNVCTDVDETMTVSGGALSVKDYKFLSRIDAFLNMMHAVDVEASSVRDRRTSAHVYPLRKFIFNCCRRGICDLSLVC